MTSYVISTSQTTTETLSADYDDLLVTSAGSIIDTTIGDYGVDATANNQQITIDGLVYSLNDLLNNGVGITGEGTTLNVSGQVQGDTGVGVYQGTLDSISVSSQGAIVGGSFAVLFSAVTDPSVTTDSLVNAGDISGPQAVGAEFEGGDVIDNSGQISGEVGVYFDKDVAKETVENSGTITGVANRGSISSAIVTRAASAGIEVVNSGVLTDDGTNAINTADLALLYFDDNSGTTSTIDNSGSVSGSGYVIQSISDILDISNSGTVHGGLYSTAAVGIDNSGVWENGAGSAPIFVLDGGNNSVTNTASGVIDGAISTAHSHDIVNNAGAIGGGISLVSGHDTITNAGGIDGPITFSGSTNTNSLTNSGKITGAVAFSGGYNMVDNSGTIDGEVSIAHSHDTFNNAGTIDGAVALTAGSDMFTNTGAIDGEVMLWSTGTTNTVTNSGDIKGNVTMSAPSSALADHGQIYGNIILGTSDTLINTGTIHGNVTLGSSDTFDLSPGIVTGVINASTVTGSPGDLFEFSGDFGKVTLDDFVGGTGTNHDTIQFAANDFGILSQVQSASSQVGADVVIKLDATDAITLNNVTLASLVSADFKFV